MYPSDRQMNKSLKTKTPLHAGQIEIYNPELTRLMMIQVKERAENNRYARMEVGGLMNFYGANEKVGRNHAYAIGYSTNRNSNKYVRVTIQKPEIHYEKKVYIAVLEPDMYLVGQKNSESYNNIIDLANYLIGVCNEMMKEHFTNAYIEGTNMIGNYFGQ